MSEEVKNPNYWKSLGELARNDEYEKYVEREFPENATELNDDVSRRSFLRVMGASIAMAGFAACRRPVEKILPYTEMPEDVIPGNPLYYASSMPFQDALTGIVVENNEGRPSKVEGNELHPASEGKTGIFEQGSILNMYDPDRSRYVRKGRERSSLNAFASFCKEHFADTTQNIAFVSEANSSPTFNRLKDEAMEQYPNAEWITYEAFGEDNVLEGTNIAFGQQLRTVNHFENASVIVTLDDDFLNPVANKNSLANTRQFSDTRELSSPEDDMSRMYAVESTFSLTGSNADNRLRIKSSDIEPFLYALAAELSSSVNGLSAFNDHNNEFSDHEWVSILAEELLENRGESLVTVGREHKPALHAVVSAINVALDNNDETVSYVEVPHLEDRNPGAFVNFVEDLNNGNIDTVVIVGKNPAFTAPADLNFSDAVSNAGQVIHLSDYYDETSKLADWHINRAHFLEAWGDGYSFRGARSIIQPQIEPLYSGISEHEFLSIIIDGEQTKGYDLVQETWQSFYTSNFQNQWEQVLHDGVADNEGFPAASVSISSNFSSQATEFINNVSGSSDGMELVIRPDSTIFDGRFANNGWLQELPDPMTKITWDNVALMSKKTADELGVEQAGLGKSEVEVVAITIDDTTVEMPAWVQPGHADDSITVTVGYGNDDLGRVSTNAGTDAYPLRKTDAMLYATDISVENTGKKYEVACTQDHNTMEGRSLLRHATLQEYRDHPEFSHYEEHFDAQMPGLSYIDPDDGGEDTMSIFDSITKNDYPEDEPQWGMTIDLNTCIGCGTCTIACQAENNIPVVGKREVSRGREMHWIRTDRYYDGDVNNPDALHQPVPCMHCELAPCEQVCPVAATTHSDSGLNQMTYNRCIGTRYCANNCPYKVRRFNFFNYAEEFLTSGDDPEIVQMAMNPDVTIRFRGVMEKCTYCVQRLNRAKIKRDNETDGRTMKPEDGAVETACQEACPANAIYFGDLTDPDSKIVETKKNNRNYLLLEELNTRPRTSYLAEIRNPNPKLA